MASGCLAAFPLLGVSSSLQKAASARGPICNAAVSRVFLRFCHAVADYHRRAPFLACLSLRSYSCVWGLGVCGGSKTQRSAHLAVPTIQFGDLDNRGAPSECSRRNTLCSGLSFIHEYRDTEPIELPIPE